MRDKTNEDKTLRKVKGGRSSSPVAIRDIGCGGVFEVGPGSDQAPILFGSNSLV